MAAVTETQSKVSLWHHRNFLRLWVSDTISQFGTQFSGLAIPFTLLLLTKDPFPFAVLNAVAVVPFPAFALLIGVYVDRRHRKHIMTLANIGRGISLGLVPIAALTGVLLHVGIVLLYVVSFSVGLLTVFFDVSYQAILPSLVERDQLVEGNSMLQFSASSAQVAGPAMAGIVVQAVYPPLALAIDASSYLVSASFLSSIRAQEVIQETTKSVWHDLREGLAVVMKDKRLRMIAGSTATSNLFSSAIFPISIPYFVLQLGFTAGVIGFIGTVGAIGLLVGVFLSSLVVRNIGLGWAIVSSMLLGGIALVPYAIVNPGLTNPALATFGPLPVLGTLRVDRNVLLLMFANFVLSIGVVVYNINQVSLRQALVPLRLQGRMNASMRWIVWGTIPAGAILGGVLAETVGVRTAIQIAVIGGLFSFLWVLLSPVRSLKSVPEQLS